MGKIIICLFIMFFSTSLLAAEIGTDAFLYESISVGTSSVKTGTSTLNNADLDGYQFFEAMYTVETNPVRYLFTGTPTASEGILLNANDVLTTKSITNARNFRAVGTTGTATIKVQYSRK